MATHASPSNPAGQARRLYAEELVKGLPALIQAVMTTARELLDKPAEPALQLSRRDLWQELQKGAQPWHRSMVSGLQQLLLHGTLPSRAAELASAGSRGKSLSLVDDDTIEHEILCSRLALAIMDRASWEFTDLRSRIVSLERRDDLDPQDLLRAHVLARIVVDAWLAAGLGLARWKELQRPLQAEFAVLVEESYHEANRWLAQQGVLPDIDLRPLIRRSRGGPPPSGFRASSFGAGLPSGFGAQGPGDAYRSFGSGQAAAVGEETRMMTRASALARRGEHAEAVLGRLNRLVGRQVPSFGAAPAPLSPGLASAIDEAEVGIRQRIAATTQRGAPVTTPDLIDELQRRKQSLKKAATTPDERAIIEIVALLFQSILTEERIPASVRVWFARLQMPVLRVAIGEPDFFATLDHPARRLIDRMGACVMGFDSAMRGVGDALEKEIKRVAQVVEAYPDTGRRVFQTVLVEFEKFLDNYFRNENEVTKKGVSLAQQVEQRETLAIQYTIEMRKMLDQVPVQDGVRDFLFHVWADVLATTAVQNGPQGEVTRTMKRAAADLVWSASAKVTREERAEVLRRLPPLLKTLREGMTLAGIEGRNQDAQIQQLNNSLAAAFTAKAAVIPQERLRELAERLESIEQLLSDSGDPGFDESLVLDLSSHESQGLEVVAEGGSMPTPAMVAWARELQVGSWYMLDYRGSNESVQLAWQGMRRQLSLFVTPHGRCVLFQQRRLAAFLQAGLLLPAQEESLTVKATRSALAKIDLDPSRLLS